MYILGRTQMLPQFSITDSVKFIMDSGFDGVEISPFDKRFQPRDEFYAPDFAPRMLEALAAAGVEHYAVSAHMDISVDRESFEIVRRTLEVAHKLGVKYVVSSPAHQYPGDQHHIRWAKNIRTLREMCKIAESLDLKLAIEFEPGFIFDNTEQMLIGFADIGSDALGINCDIGHMFLRDKDPMKAIEMSAPYILHGHIENMATGIHNHLVPWEGDMDLGAYIKKLREVGFDGMMGLDLYAYEYADVCVESVKFIKNLL